MTRISLIILFISLLVVSCATTEETIKSDTADAPTAEPYLTITEDVIEQFVVEELDELQLQLLQTRSSLSDQFSNLEHDMPELFTREIVREEREIDEYAGYRVQILSTRDVVHADTTRDSFVAWADTKIDGFQPEAYVFFRQPYYRVRAGDFRDRDKAIEFSRILKEFYPDAWVVHDRIEPFRVPADTVQIKLAEPEDSEN